MGALLRALVVLVGLIWCGAAAASPAPLGTITDFPIPPSGANTVPTPASIVTGPDGSLWFADGGTATPLGAAGSAIGRIDPATHAITEYQPPPPSTFANSDILGITAGPGPDLWFANDDGVGSFNAFTHAIAQYQITSSPSTYAGPIPEQLAAGPDGNVWFVGNSNISGSVGAFSPATQTFALLPIPPLAGNPYPIAESIVAGPDGNMWFTDFGKVGAVGTVNIATHAITQYPLPVPAGGGPHGAFGIARGPDGNIWFTTNGAIGMANVATHAIVEYPIPATGGNTHPAPGPIAAGPGGELWFVDEGTVPSVGIIDPATHAITEQPIPSGSLELSALTAGPDGNVWFAAPGRFPGVGGAIAVMTVPRVVAQLSRLRVRVHVAAPGRRRSVRLTVSYRLTLAAGLTFTISRSAPGRIAGGRCVAPTRANAGHRRCTRPGAPVESISRLSSAGPRSFSFAGRAGGRALASGSYFLTATPLDGAGAGKTRTLQFAVGS